MSDHTDPHKLGYCCRYAANETCIGCGDEENGIPLAQPPTSKKCGHRNVIGHEWSSTCQDCGETWQHRTPESVTVTLKDEQLKQALGWKPPLKGGEEK